MSTGPYEPEPYKLYGVEEAKKRFSELINSGETIRLTRTTTDSETMSALLVPVRELSQRQRAALPAVSAHLLSEARGKLGALVALAVSGAPQRLQKRGKDTAVLLPDTPEVADGGLGQGLVADHDAAAGTAAPAPAESAAPRPRRRLVTQADALAAVSGAGGRTATYGLRDLDQATGGLRPGRLALVAAAPGVGGSLLAVSAARATAVLDGRPVLYAAIGLDAATVSCRVAAAHAGTSYQRLRAGTLDAPPDVAARIDETQKAPLFVDDGTDLDTGVLADTVAQERQRLEDGLVIVDRLQAAPDPSVPMSGDVLPDVSRALAALARAEQMPVLAVVDSDDAALLARLRADVVLRLTRDGDVARVTVADADFGSGTGGDELTLWPDFAKARFVEDPPTAPSAAPVRAPAARLEPSGPNSSVEAGESVTSPSRAPSKSRTAQHTTTGTAGHEEFLADPEVAKRITRKGQREALLERLALLDVPEIGEDEQVDRLRLWDAVEGGGDMNSAGPFGPLRHGTQPPFWQPTQPGMSEAFRSRDGITWSRPYEGEDVVRLDRNASWPSAVGSVQMAFGELKHTGDLGDLIGQSPKPGYYLTTVYPWTVPGVPAPIEGEAGSEQWVTAPRMQLLASLATAGRWPDAVALDSYTAEEPYHLREFASLVNILRRYALTVHGRDSGAYSAVKRAFGMCLGLLVGSLEGDGVQRRRRWHCKARRPDWVHHIKDQATVTMWRTADRIATAVPEHAPVAIRNTDELWLPAAALEKVTAGKKPIVRLDETGVQFGTYSMKGGK